nr:MAG TPA: hypothetical protein [Caudoviricetes sp.]
MKHVILTDYEAGQIDTYLELTSGRISEELKLWESMEGKTPNAKKNISFWKEMAQAVEKLRNQLK